MSTLSVSAPLAPLPPGSDGEAVLARFLAVAAERGLELYPEQEEAILVLLVWLLLELLKMQLIWLQMLLL